MTACIVATCSRSLRDWEDEAGMLCCTPCLSTARAQLAAIPAALTVLRDGSMQRERIGDGGRAGTREAPLPCRLDTLNLVGPAATGTVRDPHGDQVGQRPLVGVLADWVRLVLEEHPRRYDRSFKRPMAWTPEVLAAWLSSMSGWCASQAWVGEMCEELWAMTMQIRGIARVEVRTRAISRPCPACALLTLTRTDHDAYTRCSSCGNAYTDSELNADAAGRSAA